MVISVCNMASEILVATETEWQQEEVGGVWTWTNNSTPRTLSLHKANLAENIILIAIVNNYHSYF